MSSKPTRPFRIKARRAAQDARCAVDNNSKLAPQARDAMRSLADAVDALCDECDSLERFINARTDHLS